MGRPKNDTNPYMARQIKILNGEIPFESVGETALPSMLNIALLCEYEDDITKIEDMILQKARSRYQPKGHYTQIQQKMLSGEYDVTTLSKQARVGIANLIVEASAMDDKESLKQAWQLYHKWVLSAHKITYTEREIEALKGVNKECGQFLSKLRKKLLLDGKADVAYKIGCELIDNYCGHKRRSTEKNKYTHADYEIPNQYSSFHKSILSGDIDAESLVGSEEVLLSLKACADSYGTTEEQKKVNDIIKEVRIISKERHGREENNFLWAHKKKRTRPTLVIPYDHDEALDIIDLYIYPAKMRE